MNNEQNGVPGMPNGAQATAAMVVCLCMLLGMWILLFKAAIGLYRALGHL